MKKIACAKCFKPVDGTRNGKKLCGECKTDAIRAYKKGMGFERPEDWITPVAEALNISRESVTNLLVIAKRKFRENWIRMYGFPDCY